MYMLGGGYVIVIARLPGIFGSKLTEYEGTARSVYIAINPWQPGHKYNIIQ